MVEVTETSVKPEAIDNASLLLKRIRILAILQIPLILVAVLSLSFVGWRVKQLREQIDTLNAQVKAKDDAIGRLDSEIGSKTAWLNQVNKLAISSGQPQQKIPLSALVLVKTKQDMFPPSTSLWLNAPREVLDEIGSVEYSFDGVLYSMDFTPEQQPIQIIEDPNSGFRATFKGRCMITDSAPTVRVIIKPKSADGSGGDIDVPLCVGAGLPY